MVLDSEDTHPTSFSFRISTTDLKVVGSPGLPARLEIEGFETRPRGAGVPDVPTKTVMVAIPPGATPRLEVTASGRVRHPGLRPSPVARKRQALTPGVQRELSRPGLTPARRAEILGRATVKVFEEDPAYFGGDDPFPSSLASLGEIGTLRDQRYVEVHLAPARFDPQSGGIELHRVLDVVIRFEGVTNPTVAHREESVFEPVYRRSFLNYEQGTRFRLSAYDAQPRQADRGAATDLRAAGDELLPGEGPGGGGSVPRYKLRVRDDGPVRLDYTRMTGTGFLAEPISTWRLTLRGVQVPFQIQDDGDDLLEPGEWVQFYGQALTDEPVAVLQTDIPTSDTDIWSARDFTDESVYFLTVDAQAQPTISTRDATPPFSLAPPAYFTAVVHEEVDDTFWPIEDQEDWFGKPFLEATNMTTNRIDQVALPGLHSGTLGAHFRVRIRGISALDAVDPDHNSSVTVRNSSAQQLVNDLGSFDGRALFTHEIPWTFTADPLTDPVEIELDSLSVGGGLNTIVLDFIEVEYPRSFTAISELLVFDWPDGDAEFVIDGLTDTTPDVYEITGASGQIPFDPVRLTGIAAVGADSVRFGIDDLATGLPRRFVVIGDGGATVPGDPDFEPDVVSDLRDHATQADLIVIAHPSVLDDGPGTPLRELLDFRATVAGGSLTSKVARLDDVQDEFNFGLAGPDAIREFLRWTTSTAGGEGWADPKPTHVLLLGDGSFDYKGGPDMGSLVPTQMQYKNEPELAHYASDNLLAAVIGDDDLPDLIVGRISARTLAEANLILQKTLDYEQNPFAGTWDRHALLVSDRGNGFDVGEALDFELTNSVAAGLVPAPWTTTSLQYWSDYCTHGMNPVCDWAGMNLDIKSELNGFGATADGAAVTQYIGHGNFWVWSSDAFFDERVDPGDTAGLTNAQTLTWMMAHNCLTGGFHITPDNTMGEGWMKRAGGGSVGVFSPSGLSFNFIGRRATEVVWGDLYGPRKERRVAVPVMNTLSALCGQGSIEACQSYILQGDPALRLGLRAVDPVRNLVATPGNAQVELSWDLSATPLAVYDVYRTDNLLRNYTRVATSVAGPSHVDPGLVNAQDYYYYVIAKDPQNFESAWSNFNTDCGVGGPDCVQAKPLNPNPPTDPTSLTITDPGVGYQLQLSWAPNPEDDVAYYTLHQGTATGDYDVVKLVADGTTTIAGNLVEGQTYFFAVTATNTSDKTSGFSVEAEEFPALSPGLALPRFIDDLVVSVQGPDIVLDWSEVTEDIHGKSKTVDFYEVYRGTTPGFDALGAAAHGSCAAPCTSFPDTDAALDPGAYYYRVRAVDADGNAGGLGADVPRWTDLAIYRSDITPGDLRLTWPAVTTTVAGDPIDLQHYVVFASDSRFTSQDVASGSVPELGTVSGTTLEITPPPQNRYYSVLAVDIRGNRSPF